MANLCILIADDSNSDRMQLSAIVRKEGHEVVEAKDGEEALLLWEQKRPDLILLDALMPKMDGFEVAQTIKEKSGNELIPIIFLTSLQDANSLARCLQSGGDDFLSKPVNQVELIKRVENMLKLKDVTDEVNRLRCYIEEMEASTGPQQGE